MATWFFVIFIVFVVISFCEIDAIEDRIVSCNYSVNNFVLELSCSCTAANEEAPLEKWLNAMHDAKTTCKRTALPHCTTDVALRIQNCLWPNDLSAYYHQMQIDPELITEFEFHLHPVSGQAISLTNTSLQGLNRLRSLNLKLGNVFHISENAFENLKSLETMDLSRNNIWKIENRLFHENNELKKIDLSHNHILSISDVTFSSTTKLQTLDLSYNSIDTPITNNLFKKLTSLQYLNLRKNIIKDVRGSAFNGLHSLRSIDLSQNRIQFPKHLCKENHDSSGSGDKNYYLLANLADHTDYDVSINLTSNNITEVSLTPIRNTCLPRSGRCQKTTTIHLHHNPLNCTCGVYDLIEYFHGRLESYINRSIRINEDPGCLDANTKKWTKLLLVNISEIVCDWTNCENCPKNCKCSYDKNTNRVIINCDGANLQRIPTIPNDQPMGSRIELRMRNNSLRTVNDINVAHEYVTILSLSHNEITNVSSMSLYKYSKLEILELNDNKLEILNRAFVKQLQHLTNLNSITLGNNPWKCDDCNNVELINFLKTASNVHDVDLMKCSGTNILVKSYEAKSCDHVDSFNSSVLGLAIFISITVPVSLYVLYKYKTKPTITWPQISDIEMHDKLYDTFISYSHEDETFVAELVNKLEAQANHYNICLHSRNWKPGEFIVKQMVESIKQSRSTIIVLTMAYTKSEWCSAEFQLALTHMLVRKNHKVIVLWCSEQDPDELELESSFKSYLQMCTYLKIDSQWNFLKKLETAIERVAVNEELRPLNGVVRMS